MATEIFEITSYNVGISRERNVTRQGLELKVCASITCQGTDHTVYVIVLGDTSPVPKNEYTPASKVGVIFIPRWQFEWFRDLLRNERPVSCLVDTAAPRNISIFTGAEPTGEQEGSPPL